MTDRKHPYANVSARSHWMHAVAGKHSLDIADWYTKKFPIEDRQVATAGSCFAQHIGRRMREAGFSYVDAEPAPEFVVNRQTRQDFGYDMYSARYGNVYTPRQLLQLFQRAFGTFQPKDDHWTWKDGVVDPFRPTIEPEPFSSVEELRRSRKHHLAAVREVFEAADVFVFTLGLTECFASMADGAVYPVAPGVSGGAYEPTAHQFENFDDIAIRKDLVALFEAARKVHPKMRFILTVSPVPLMATASGRHVVVATTYSKSTLRAAAGALQEQLPYVDYFPAFEIISSPPMRGQFYEPDMRGVSNWGVDHVMRQFFAVHRPPAKAPKAAAPSAPDRDAAACDEELLRTFGPAA